MGSAAWAEAFAAGEKWGVDNDKRIDRQVVVSRNNPHVIQLDSLQSLTVGNGGFAFTVDATGLQTFPERYSQGVPLGTMSDWGWHSFPNTEGFRAEEALQSYDFGHTHKFEFNKQGEVQGGSLKVEPYSVENKDAPRAKAAANYLRANPHRLHLGCMGLNLQEAEEVTDVDQTLDLWTGTIRSQFNYKGKRYIVEAVCHPERDLVATKVKVLLPLGVKQRKNVESIVMRFPYPSGQHSDDACVWDSPENENWTRHQTVCESEDENWALLRRTIDSTSYYVRLSWQGKRTESSNGGAFPQMNLRQEFAFEGTEFSFCCEFTPEKTCDDILSYQQVKAAATAHWQQYWQSGAIIDFSECTDPRAAELERRAVLSQYLLAVNCAGSTPPQETGLTYNSWFGKYHLEMIWWHQAQFALWGHPELLERSLDWYFQAFPKAREIAGRQGFPGVRWMKMTDPSAEEAPSKVGSFLIWQQPHVIHLAELLRRAAEEKGGPIAGREVMRKYWPLVEPTATFMNAFADYDAENDRYVLRGVIPAQETLRAAETVNPPFELSYWHWGLTTAAAWSQKLNGTVQTDWLTTAEKLSPLAFNSDSLYLAAETATDTYRDVRFTSDHPAVLGAYGILPWTSQMNRRVMANTLDWIWDNWNWNKTWGWDYPMVAMNAARLGDAEKAVDALLMDKRTNTYLISGHNYQDQRLRLYLPGNGGLLTALAMMCAGWDGCSEPNPGFPKDEKWNVKWEGLMKLP
ncbi:MAG: hypothetical protein K6C10_04725 [Prevotella sp.]|nr:hypothetical protein [Prevotella sp.]